jgi:transcriptional regulator with XRE-family HTH domain/alkylhydroperoxidase/carboxymuconolactone decarboxylase family protein YurZ
VDQARTIGDRVRDARRRRGLTQRELADLSGMSLSLVRKLEQGEREDVRIETARKLAVSLDVPTMALIGDAPALPPVTSGPAWEPVRLALADPVSGIDLEPVTEDGLSEALTAAVRLYHDNQYDSLGLVLPGLLRDARDASPLLRSRVLQLTGSLMVQTRQRDLARIALDRSLADAEESGSVLDAASSVITMCWLLLLEQQFQEVRTLALQWADRIEPRFSVATPAELSTWGWLLLRASAAAIRDNRPGEAAHAMRLAEAAAVSVGRERGSYHSYWTTFGPATLAMKQVENAVVDGKPDIALALAARVPGNLRPTSDNRNRHLLDVTAAHLDLRHYPDAFDVLYRLYQEVPAWLANQRMASDLLDKIVTRRRTLTPDMRELADFLHLPL